MPTRTNNRSWSRVSGANPFNRWGVGTRLRVPVWVLNSKGSSLNTPPQPQLSDLQYVLGGLGIDPPNLANMPPNIPQLNRRTDLIPGSYNFSPYAPPQGAEPGTYRYQSPSLADVRAESDRIRNTDIAANTAMQQNATNKQEQTWAWQDYYHKMVGQSLGLGKYADTKFDPLAQLQEQLQDQYDPSFINRLQSSGTAQPFEDMLARRNEAVNQGLGARAAGLGVQDAYSGLMQEQNQMRSLFANQAHAMYTPAAYQRGREYEDMSNQLLNAINQAELSSERLYATSGV